MLRETAIKVVRHLGIVGECNIQCVCLVRPCHGPCSRVRRVLRLSIPSILRRYALHPTSLDYVIIEVRPARALRFVPVETHSVP